MGWEQRTEERKWDGDGELGDKGQKHGIEKREQRWRGRNEGHRSLGMQMEGIGTRDTCWESKSVALATSYIFYQF